MGKIFKRENVKKYLIYYLIMEIFMKFSITQFLIKIIIEGIQIILYSSNIMQFVKSLVVLVVWIIFCIISIMITTGPLTIYLLAKKSVDVTREIQNRKYNSKEDIVYFREKLDGISPCTISIMKNLRVEEEKDLAATLMKLQLNKNIHIENDTINVLSEDVTNLTSSEKQLLYMIADQKINKMQIEAWKVAAIGEAKNLGYIKEKNPKKGLFSKKLILIGILILLYFGSKNCYSKLDEYDLRIQELEQNYTEINDEIHIYELVEKEWFGEFAYLFLNLFCLLLCVMSLLGWPIFYFIYVKRYKGGKHSLKRTEKGEQLTDVILAMKRFIHDFSILDTATKEQIILWDDFLIYAIVLEENKKIVDEILNIKDIKNINTQNLIK